MFHANGWTFTWTVTAAGARHVCLRKVEPATVFRLARDEGVDAPVRRTDRPDWTCECTGVGAGGCAFAGFACSRPELRRLPSRFSAWRKGLAGPSLSSTA